MNWRAIAFGKIDQEYRKAFRSDDINQARIVFAIVAFWILGYSYVDYLELGLTKTFQQLLILRIVFFSASGMISIRIAKLKKVNLIDLTILAWSTALVSLALLSNASRGTASIIDIMLHYVLILGFYLLIPNRLIFKMLPALIITVVDFLILITYQKAELPGFTSYLTLKSISTLVILNVLGLILSIRADVQRFKQFLIQKTLMDGRAQLKQLATTDSLTGILNRRSFIEAAEVQFDRFKRYKEIFSFVIIDIDKLKIINDTYGHPAGDHAIRLLTETIHAEKRSSDTVGRLAGDEFGIILPNTRADKALEVLLRIKLILADTIVESPNKQEFQVSFSAGVANVSKLDITFDDLYRRADKALLMAKQLGRNRINTA